MRLRGAENSRDEDESVWGEPPTRAQRSGCLAVRPAKELVPLRRVAGALRRARSWGGALGAGRADRVGGSDCSGAAVPDIEPEAWFARLARWRAVAGEGCEHRDDEESEKRFGERAGHLGGVVVELDQRVRKPADLAS